MGEIDLSVMPKHCFAAPDAYPQNRQGCNLHRGSATGLAATGVERLVRQKLNTKIGWRPNRSFLALPHWQVFRSPSLIAKNNQAQSFTLPLNPAKARIPQDSEGNPDSCLGGPSEFSAATTANLTGGHAKSNFLISTFFSSHSPRPKAPAISTCSGWRLRKVL